ncbi:MFS transporter [Micromonospora sp. NPDC047465]|uniref:MFS transporter n=1 Tax=Micromonospora sp. NPDC047465 TaxID=3154813 RepID=UPI00340DDFAA
MTVTSAATVPVGAMEPAGPARVRRWLGLAALLTGMFVVQVDFFIVNVALPPIQQDLHATLSEIQLVAVSYAGAVGLTVVTGGRLGDVYGRRRIFLVGMAGIALASLLGGLAWSAPMLVVARILQGFAAGLVLPQGIGSVHAMFSGRDRERAFAVFGAAMGLSWASGMVFGGLLIEADIAGSGWRSIFLVNVLLALLAWLGTARWFDETKRSSTTRLDTAGALALTVVTALVLVPLIQGPPAGWPMWTLLCLFFAAVGAVVLIRVERRTARAGGAPLLPPHLFRDRQFDIGLLVIGIFFLGPPGYFLLTSIYLQSVLDFSPFESGMSLLPFSLLFFVSADVVKRLKARLNESVIIVGVLVMMVGTVVVGLTVHIAGTDLTVLRLTPGVALLGFGQALVTTPLMEMLLRHVPKGIAATASGVFTTVQLIAQQIGVALAVIIFTAFVTHQLDRTAPEQAWEVQTSVVDSGGTEAQAQRAVADVADCAARAAGELTGATGHSCAGADGWTALVDAAADRAVTVAARDAFVHTLGYNLLVQLTTAAIMVLHVRRLRRRPVPPAVGSPTGRVA